MQDQVTTTLTAPTAGTGTHQPRRVKIFTVHGTFAHEADWDNWDPKPEDEKKLQSGKPRNFVNRLSYALREKGVAFDHADHTEYNWSGGNSHDERRTAAIGLKKLIEKELSRTQTEHGVSYQEYYNGGVYVIGHSHGGTLSRIAMNLWDKDSDYYQPIRIVDPVTGVLTYDEFKQDDHCAHCKQERHGKVGPNTVEKPDLVITLGSPFVTFEDRRNGLLAAKIAVWGFRALMALLILIYLYSLNQIVALLQMNKSATADPMAAKENPDFNPRQVLFGYFNGLSDALFGVTLDAPMVQIAALLIAPVFLYWLCVGYPARRLIRKLEEWRIESTVLNAAAAIARLVSLIGVIALAVYYVALLTRGKAGVSWMIDLLGQPTAVIWMAWIIPLVAYWAFVISLPGRLLSGLADEVARLKDRLPVKYDPRGEKQVAFVNYTTPGDEAGLGLKLQGFITWLVQTLWLATAVAALFAVFLQVISLNSGHADGFMHDASPQLVSRTIAIMNIVTLLPVAVWNGLSWTFGWIPGLSSLHPVMNISDLPVAEQAGVARKVGHAMDVVTVKLLFQLIPMALAMTALSFLVSKWLRNSQVGFGNERLAWTLASKISIAKRANENSMLRNIVISPLAWWNRDIAHCYYYKCDPVIQDVAGFIADRNLHKADRPWPIERIVASAMTWLIVLIVCLGIFAAAVSVAKNAVS